MMRDGAQHYQTVEIQSMSPARRVVFLYNFLLAKLRLAKKALEENNVAERTTHFLKAQDAIIELLSALNEEASQELVGRLASLYAYFQGEIVQIGARPSVERLDKLICLVSTLHDSWAEAASQYEPHSDPSESPGV